MKKAAAFVLALAACSGASEVSYQGYAEGEYVRVASPFPGRLVALDVGRGSHVASGSRLFALENVDEAAAKSEAEARLARARAELENLTKGRRAPEVEAAKAELAQAEANLKLSEVQLRRREHLIDAKAVSKQELDEARATFHRNRAQVAELRARLATTRLPAREDEIEAQRAEVAAAQAELEQAEWRLEQKSILATVSAPVTDTFYRVGEWVPAGSPVVEMLPPENIKLKFFVPETKLAEVQIGEEIVFTCDGCGEPKKATVTFISPEAEFTPPVIYSRDSRAKLVFLIEAKPADPKALHPGQPVDVRLE